MIHFSRRTLLAIAGLTWFAVGIYLLPLGLNFLVKEGNGVSFFSSWLVNLVGKDQSAVLLIAAALALGFMKAKVVLSKSVVVTYQTLLAGPEKNTFRSIFTNRYLALIALMMALGMSLTLFSCPLDLRGFVDVAIGAALLNGSMLYFRFARAS